MCYIPMSVLHMFSLPDITKGGLRNFLRAGANREGVFFLDHHSFTCANLTDLLIFFTARNKSFCDEYPVALLVPNTYLSIVTLQYQY